MYLYIQMRGNIWYNWGVMKSMKNVSYWMSWKVSPFIDLFRWKYTSYFQVQNLNATNMGLLKYYFFVFQSSAKISVQYVKNLHVF